MRCWRTVTAWVGLGMLLLALGLGSAAEPAKAPAKARQKGHELTVTGFERWLDTIKGTVKNEGKNPARDVTVEVKFLDRKRKHLGTQRVSVGDLRPGDQSSFSLAIAEGNRPAKFYQFAPQARRP